MWSVGNKVEGMQNDISDGVEALWHLFMTVFLGNHLFVQHWTATLDCWNQWTINIWKTAATNPQAVIKPIFDPTRAEYGLYYPLIRFLSSAGKAFVLWSWYNCSV